MRGGDLNAPRADIAMEEKVQSEIMLGALAVPRTHPDFEATLRPLASASWSRSARLPFAAASTKRMN